MPDGDGGIESKPVRLSDSAVERLRALAAEPEHEGLVLRVAVQGGGCSGFSYSFTFDDQVNEDDHRVEKDGVSVVIDDMSWTYLAGAEIGYRNELIGAYFSIENPNAASTCGCGTSFAVF